eukprot:scaffold21538_cov41-Cyclotella_meneghiniana.AAC.9
MDADSLNLPSGQTEQLLSSARYQNRSSQNNNLSMGVAVVAAVMGVDLGVMDGGSQIDACDTMVREIRGQVSNQPLWTLCFVGMSACRLLP